MSISIRPRHETAQVDRALEYMERQYPHIATLPDVAERLGANYHTLREAFRRETGLTISAYLTRVRLIRACRLLCTSDLLVKEIAGAVGYEREHQLARAFRTHFGATPEHVRSRCRLRSMVHRSLALSQRLLRG